jgi:hypothetical protein
MPRVSLLPLLAVLALGPSRCESPRTDNDAGPIRPGTGEACGPARCASDQICCNESCGICTPRGGACTKQFCVPQPADAGTPDAGKPDAGATHAKTCGGFAGIACPGLGLCEDDKGDDCDPRRGGADCGGICTCEAKAKCRAGQTWNASPDACRCEGGAEPEADAGPSERVFCGGIAAFPCPGGGSCADNPDDGCDPMRGGADCGGVCRCDVLGVCVAGSEWNSSPTVCACEATADAGP